MLNQQNFINILKKNHLIKDEHNNIYQNIGNDIKSIIHNIINEYSNMMLIQLDNDKNILNSLNNINLPYKYKYNIMEYFLDNYIFYDSIFIENDNKYYIIFDLNNIIIELSKLN